MPARTTSACARTGPERHRLAAHERRIVDDQHVRVVEVVRRAPPRCPAGAACRRPRASSRPAELLALPLHREHDEVAALGDHAREHGLADQARSAAGSRPRPRPEPRVSELVGDRASSAYWSTSVRAWSLKSRGIVRGFRSGQQPLPEQDDDRDRAGDERHADERELEEPERGPPRRRPRRRRRSR